MRIFFAVDVSIIILSCVLLRFITLMSDGTSNRYLSGGLSLLALSGSGVCIFKAQEKRKWLYLLSAVIFVVIILVFSTMMTNGHPFEGLLSIVGNERSTLVVTLILMIIYLFMGIRTLELYETLSERIVSSHIGATTGAVFGVSFVVMSNTMNNEPGWIIDLVVAYAVIAGSISGAICGLQRREGSVSLAGFIAGGLLKGSFEGSLYGAIFGSILGLIIHNKDQWGHLLRGEKVEDILVAHIGSNSGKWRRVKAVRIKSNTYKIIGKNADPEKNNWLFVEGDTVQCEVRHFEGGSIGLVAVNKIQE